MKKLALLLFLSISIQTVWAQVAEPLDLEKALQLGLENNLQVKIGIENKNLRELDKKVAAGNLFLPTVNANYLRNFSTEDVTQTFVSDPENPREIDAAKSRNKAYSLVGIYGFRPESLVTMRRLGVLEEISDLDAKVIVENTVAGVSTAYFRLILEQPMGVGFSYCSRQLEGKVCKNTDDYTARASRAGLVDFFTTKFPELLENEFYITGESYAGVYIPTLTKEILEHPTSKDLINLNGIAVGDPCTDNDAQKDSMDPLVSS